MPSQPDDAERFAREVKRERVTLSRRIEQVLAPSRLFKRLFTGPDGQLTPDAVAWFDLVGRECFAGRSTFDADARRHAYQQGANDAFNLQLEYGRIDERRLAGLVRQARELDDE
jgi:hypothetical protein